MAIDIGQPAIDRGSQLVGGWTGICGANPANASGTITSVEIWAKVDISGCKVGTFYVITGDTLKCRDVVTIGDVPKGSKQTFPDLSLSVQADDYIGIYFTGGQLERDTSGADGLWYVTGDYCIVDAEATFIWDSDGALSLYGTGTEAGGPGYYQLQYTSEPPTPNAWNQLKQEAGVGYVKILFEGE